MLVCPGVQEDGWVACLSSVTSGDHLAWAIALEVTRCMEIPKPMLANSCLCLSSFSGTPPCPPVSGYCAAYQGRNVSW
jgi:hypothetical protein